MADLLTGLDADVAISNAAITDATDTTAEFAALTWVLVGFIESTSDYGDASADVTGNVISEGRTRHAKGTRDAGIFTLTCFHKPDDVGQLALAAAQLTSNRYGIRIRPRDRLTGGGTDSIDYFRGIIQSARRSALEANTPQRIVYNIGIDSQIYNVAAT
jgi:hypothetical protein